MQRIKYIPPWGTEDDTSTHVVFDLVPPYIIGSPSGLSGVPTTVLSTSAPGLDGSIINNIRIEDREIKTFIHIDGKSRQDMYNKRIDLVDRLMPKRSKDFNGLGTLFYTNDAGTFKIGAIPINSPEPTERIKNYNRCEIVFRCPNPYWFSADRYEAALWGSPGGLTLPFVLPAKLGDVDYHVEIDNQSRLFSPVQITVHGSFSNLSIMNKTTGDIITTQKEVEDNTILVINTTDGAKSAVVQNEESGLSGNGWQYISPAFTSFKLRPGINSIEIQGIGYGRNSSIQMRWSDAYGGV